MYRRAFIKTGILCALLALGCSSLAYARDEGTVKVQGIIMAVDAKKNTMIVNERKFVWDQKTTVHNEKGSPTEFERIKEQMNVYIVGDQDGKDKRVMIKRIYLLPKRIDKKDRHRYAFMD